MADKSEDIASTSGGTYFTRSKMHNQFKAAGVLPLAMDSTGAAVVLLGAEPCRTGPKGCVTKTMWRDFGGLREAIDVGPEDTASREFAEETLGLFSSVAVSAGGVALSHEAMAAQLRHRRHSLHVIHQLRKGAYSMFIALLPYLDPLMFHLAMQQNEQTRAVQGAEKTAFAWVRLDALLAATRHCAASYNLRCWAAVSGGAHTRRPVSRGRRCLQLHPCFASSVRLARKGDLGQLVAAARRMLAPPIAPLLDIAPAPQSPVAEGERRSVERDASQACSAQRRASLQSGAAEACSAPSRCSEGQPADDVARFADGQAAAVAGHELSDNGGLSAEIPAAEEVRWESTAAAPDPWPTPACDPRVGQQPGSSSTWSTDSLFDLTPEWQRALQSLAQIPSLGVFAKRVKRTPVDAARV